MTVTSITIAYKSLDVSMSFDGYVSTQTAREEVIKLLEEALASVDKAKGKVVANYSVGLQLNEEQLEKLKRDVEVLEKIT